MSLAPYLEFASIFIRTRASCGMWREPDLKVGRLDVMDRRSLDFGFDDLVSLVCSVLRNIGLPFELDSGVTS